MNEREGELMGVKIKHVAGFFFNFLPLLVTLCYRAGKKAVKKLFFLKKFRCVRILARSVSTLSLTYEYLRSAAREVHMFCCHSNQLLPGNLKIH